MISFKKFAAITLNLSRKAFILHVTYLNSKTLIYLICEAQIAVLLAIKISILAKYLDFSDFFSKKLACKLLKHSRINKHSINLKPGKQPLYDLIYCLKSVKLEIFKTYIKTNLGNGFIWPSKSSVKILILFL